MPLPFSKEETCMYGRHVANSDLKPYLLATKFTLPEPLLAIISVAGRLSSKRIDATRGNAALLTGNANDRQFKSGSGSDDSDPPKFIY